MRDVEKLGYERFSLTGLSKSDFQEEYLEEDSEISDKESDLSDSDF
jgi:hypothetical protein